MYKTSIVILVVVLIGSTGCKKKELEKLRKENQTLSQQIEQKDSTIKALKNLQGEIEQNLQLMAQKEEGLDSAEIAKIATPRLRDRLTKLNDRVKTNKEKVESLRSQIQGNRYQADQYKKKVNRLKEEVKRVEDSLEIINEDLMAKTKQIKNMSSKLAKQDSTISKLTKQNEEYLDSLKKQNKLINTVYIATGPEKELIEDDVVIKKGGFLGFIGQTTVLNPVFSKSDFNTFNIPEFNSVTIETKKRKIDLVTAHPENSYTLKGKNGDHTVLTITDKEQFWRGGNYLVVTY